MPDNDESPKIWKRNRLMLLLAILCAAAFCIGVVCVVAIVIRGPYESMRDNRSSLIQSTEPDPKCSGNRIFFGSITDKFSHYVNSTGIFLKQPNKDEDGRHRYRHESSGKYLYYTEDGYWVAGEPDAKRTDDSRVHMRMKSTAMRPDLEVELWSVRSGRSWQQQVMLVAVCVQDAFRTCSGRLLRVSGIEAWPGEQRKVMGMYQMMTSVRRHNRPAYKHVVANAYLYFDGDMWTISDAIRDGLTWDERKRLSYAERRIEADDYAVRPEYIVHMWYLYNPIGKYVAYKTDMKITCEETADESDYGAQPYELVPSPNCVSPFMYRGRKYRDCITIGSKIYWCSHSTVFDGRWDYCDPSSVRPPPACHFPFTYKSHVYKACTMVDSPRHWCSTSAVYNKRSLRYCGKSPSLY